MRDIGIFIAVIAVVAPAAAWACSCAHPEYLSETQLRHAMKDLAIVGYGRVQATRYPAACQIAPLRWFNAALGMRVPVTYKVRIRRVVWGRSARNIDVVQYQQVGWSGCRPLGSAACDPALPSGDALWPLLRSDTGALTHAGRCGIELATHVLRLRPRAGAISVR